MSIENIKHEIVRLQTLREELYQKAKADGSLETCKEVARWLGERQSYDWWRWTNNEISIDYLVVDEQLTVYVENKVVCRSKNDYGFFVPGDWYKRVRMRLVAIEKAKREHEMQMALTELHELRRQLGMEEQDEDDQSQAVGKENSRA